MSADRAHQDTSCESKTIKKFTLSSPDTTNDGLESNVPDTPAIRLVRSIEALRKGFLGDRNWDCKRVESGSQTLIHAPIEGSWRTQDCSSQYSLTSLKVPEEELPTILPFPDLTDDFLKKLGLHDDSPKLDLAKDEIEKIFKSLAIQMDLNMKDVQERLQKQKAECEKQHKRCLYLVKDISTRLRDHKCIGAQDPINPVFILLEDVRFQIQSMIPSAGQLGIISCESRMAKCWQLVLNYVTELKKEIQHSKAPSKEKDTDTDDLFLRVKKKPVKRSSRLSTYIWIVSISLFVLGLLTLHLKCYFAEDYESCVSDIFMELIQTGDPPC